MHSIITVTVEEFVSSRKIGKTFDIGQALKYPFNMESNEGGASITIDNSVLYYTKCIRDQSGYNNCDIFYAYNKGNGLWSKIYEFSDSISRVDSWDSQPTVSSDGNTIIFSSDRDGGYGKMDLYEINKENGVWTYPKNLGSKINSTEYEKSPFLHPDGKTLFFSSTNFPALGGFDIFYSRKDSLGFWGTPVNIGYPINTLADEISIFVSTDGSRAYFSSNTLDGFGGWDIYSFALHDKAKPNRVLFIKGSVVREYGQNVDGVDINIKNLDTQKVTSVKTTLRKFV